MLLSIVIPTKNRYQYLKYLVEDVSRFQDDDIEIVIQDNSDNNTEFMEFMQPYLSGRIKYFYCNEPLSGRENSDRAILNSIGEYVCFIGDDDGVSIKIMNLVRWMKEKGYESCVFKPPTYSWPDFVDRIQLTKGMWIPKFKNFTEEVNIENELNIFLKTGGCNSKKLPCVYHGIISRTALDEVYRITGSFFPGMSLDIANATALSFVVKKHVHVGIPYTVGGMGGASTFGGGNNLHPKKGEFGGIKGLDPNIKKIWEKEIPLIWTVTSCSVHAVIQSIRAMGREDVLKDFNYNYFYGAFIAIDPQLLSITIPFVKGLKNKIAVFFHIIGFMWIRSSLFIKNYSRWRLNIFRRKIESEKVPTIKEAVAMLDKHISDCR